MKGGGEYPGYNTLPFNDELWAAVADAQENYLDYGSATKLVHGSTGYAQTQKLNKRLSDTQVFGLNADWIINDSWSLNADVFYSSANRNNVDRNIVLEKLEQGEVTWNYDAGTMDHPVMTFPVTNAVPSEDNDGDFWPRKVTNLGFKSDAENIGAKFDFNWATDFGPLQEVNFGFSYAQNSKDVSIYAEPVNKNHVYHKNAERTKLKKNLGWSPGVPVPDELVNIGNLGGDFEGYSDRSYIVDTEAYLSWLRDPATLALLQENMDLLDAGKKKQRLDDLTAVEALAAQNNLNPYLGDESYQVQEDVTAVYVEGLLEFEIGSMDLNVITGLRYVQTDIDSSAQWLQLLSVDYTPAVFEDNGDVATPPQLNPEFSEGVVAGSKSSSYNNFLPNIIANLSITDELKLRMSASRTLTRPQLDQISPFESWSGGNKLFKTGQNVDLEPYVSTNYDLSLEWYYDEASMMSVAYFKKDVQDWIISGTTLNNPLSTLGIENPIDDNGDEINVTYDFTAPMNLDTSKLDGIEFGMIHTFDSGFGVQANFTMVDSKGSASDGSTFALEGISDSYNFIAFYEIGPFQARLAYNVRDAFLQRAQHAMTNEPRNVAEYKQLDASASFDINDNISVFFEGINLTDEATEKYGRYEQQFISYQESGPRYALGVRAKF